MTSCIDPHWLSRRARVTALDVAGAPNGVHRAYNAGIPSADRAEQPQQRECRAAPAPGVHRRRASDRSGVHVRDRRTPESRRGRNERDRSALRDVDDERSGSFRLTTALRDLGVCRTRARAAPVGSQTDANVSTCKRARMSLGATIARADDLDAPHAKERHAAHARAVPRAATDSERQHDAGERELPTPTSAALALPRGVVDESSASSRRVRSALMRRDRGARGAPGPVLVMSPAPTVSTTSPASNARRERGRQLRPLAAPRERAAGSAQSRRRRASTSRPAIGCSRAG